MDKDRRDHLIDVSQRNLDKNTEVANNAFRSMNNIIFVVGTGAFVLTISFIGYIKIHIYSSWLLLISWVCFLITITFNFLAHWITAKMALRSNELVNEERRSGFSDNGDFNKKSDNDEKMKTYKKRAKLINFFVLCSLPLGIITLIFFSWINLSLQNKDNIQFLRTLNVNKVP